MPGNWQKSCERLEFNSRGVGLAGDVYYSAVDGAIKGGIVGALAGFVLWIALKVFKVKK